ncbi:MAG: acetylornithine/succinylornithine family transaminase [Gemmatimonadetes bacterium]|nr:acetylornithine/succinylornithine family transaminase [Gemmatimonadota bacterium]
MSGTSTAPASLVGVYAQPDLVLARGEGSWVWDEEGRRYLDFTAGIAVNALGHGSPVVADAIRAALDRGLIHTSNLFPTRPVRELSRLLVELSFPGKACFCNSGAEANEAALKFSRKWALATGADGKRGFLAFRNAFHGRLFGSLAATDREAYQAPFRPLMPGVRFVELGDAAGVEALLAEGSVAAVFIEPIQGEGGVIPVPFEFLRTLRALCDRYGARLVCDEIQCGLGRTGKLFAHQHAGVTPDILTLAKPLAGGLPMGAVLVTAAVADTLQPGDLGTTFGGGPLVASAALAVVRAVSEPAFLEGVTARSHHLLRGLDALRARVPAIREVRGMGLLLGVVVDGKSSDVVARAREQGLLVVGAGPEVVRLIPPLNVTFEELDQVLEMLEAALG